MLAMIMFLRRGSSIICNANPARMSIGVINGNSPKTSSWMLASVIYHPNPIRYHIIRIGRYLNIAWYRLFLVSCSAVNQPAQS